MMRILLFAATNIAVMAVLSIALFFFERYLILDEQGVDLNIQMLSIVALVIGMGGSLISLLLSKTMAKRGMGVQVIEQPRNQTEQWLLNTVRRQATEAGIGMPEVGIFDSANPNAFATGANRNAALVAVSTGLLNNMTQDEVEAVLGHEVSHVANGDMITLTLIQGVMNTFVFFFARIIGHIVDRRLGVERGHGPGYFITVMIAQMVLGILANIIVAWFSRYREFRADEGGADLSNRYKMIAALERLKSQQPAPLPDQMKAFGIAGSIGALFATHPPLEKRIEALRNG